METTNNSTSWLLYDNTSPGLKQRQEFCISQGTAATFFTRVRQIHSSLQLMPSIFSAFCVDLLALKIIQIA